MTLSMWQRMGGIFATWADDPAVRVIIIRGRTVLLRRLRISELRSSPESIAKYTASRIAYTLFAMPKPTIARIAGSASVAVLMAPCDIQIADTATLAPAKWGSAINSTMSSS